MNSQDFRGETRKVYEEMVLALKRKDEAALRRAAINLMNLFLKGEIDQYVVEFIASNYLDAGIFWEKECKDFEIKDITLRGVYDELSALEQYGDEEAQKRVRKLLDDLDGNAPQ